MHERRYFSNVSLRASQGDEGSMVISGLAARFNVTSKDLGGWHEKIRPGAFGRSIQSDRDVYCLLNHSPDRPLGRKKNGTLSLGEDAMGLNFRCLLPNTQDGRDVHEMVRTGLLSECSFAFRSEDDAWSEEEVEDEEDRSCKMCKVRTLRQVRLYDVSVVQSPAYSATSVHTSSSGIHVSSLHASDRNLFPEGIPAEVRAHVGTAVLNNTAQERRRRLTNLFVG